MMVMGGLWPLVDPGSLLYRILKVGDPPMHPLSVLMLSFLPPPPPLYVLTLSYLSARPREPDTKGGGGDL